MDTDLTALQGGLSPYLFAVRGGDLARRKSLTGGAKTACRTGPARDRVLTTIYAARLRDLIVAVRSVPEHFSRINYGEYHYG